MTTSAYASAVAPYDPSYFQRVPYITVAEYQNAPSAMDLNNLITGSPLDQVIALQETIGRASSWIDQFTCGAWGTLCATVEIENARIWGNNQGQLIVHPKYWPVLEVQTFSYGLFGQSAASITPAGNCWIEPQQFIVQQTGGVFPFSGFSTQFGTGNGWGGFGIAGGAQYQCTWSYVNGWPTSTLAASVAVGDMSVQPVSVTGIYPNTQMTIYDLPNDEPYTVASSYVPGSAVVPLTAPLAYTHASGCMVTNLPPSVKMAAISATTALIKQRGSGAMIVSDIGDLRNIDSGGGTNQTENADWALAKQLLSPFQMMFVGY